MPFIPLTILSPLDDDDCLFMEKLYHDYSRLMFRQARRYFQDQEYIEEAVQQTCLKLIKYIPIIRRLQRNKLAAYIVTVVKSVSMDYYRKQEMTRTISFIDLDENFEENIEDSFDMEKIAQTSITKEKLKQAILQLDENDQFILVAKYLFCWTDAELAFNFGIKPGTVRSRLYRAKRKTLQILRGNDED